MSVKLTNEYKIVVSANADAGTKYAAEELAKYLKAIGGVELPIVCDCTEPADKEIVIGCTSRPGNPGSASLKNDGYILRTMDDKLFIRGMNDRGNLYGVYGLLENVLGCRFFTDSVEKIPAMDVIEIPELDETVVPPLEYRSTSWHEIISHPAFAFKRGMNNLKGTPCTNIQPKGLCHTLFQYIHPDEYFDTHPEYFSMINGVRVREQTQLCLTNPEVLEITKKRLREIILENPDCTIFSVSQMDWYNPCQCPECRRVDEEEGNSMGTMLRFVNACADLVAEEFPHVIIETLAYQYTRTPPKITRPRPNVLICLCTIECCFTHPMRECLDTARPFRYLVDHDNPIQKDIVAWSKVCDRLMIWDYTTNFRFYIAPNINLHVLQDNMNFFLENGTTAIYEQGNSQSISAEFGELRAYIISKLMWEPKGDVSAWMDEFLEGYYGTGAAKPIREYIDTLADFVTRHNIHAGIYDTPVDIIPNKLLPGLTALWDAAEAAAENEDQASRIQRSRLQLEFVKIHRKNRFDADFDAEAEAFIEKVKAHNIYRIQESCPIEKSFDQLRTGYLPGSPRTFWDPKPVDKLDKTYTD